VIKKIVRNLQEDYTIIDESEAITAEIKIIKLSEAAHSILNIFPVTADNEADISPAENKSLRIEFIGDSITCGYGVDDANENHGFTTASENAMKSYAYLTAERLDADYSMFAASGYGIISGYSDSGQRLTEKCIPPFYESLGFSFSTVSGIKPQDISWNFSRFVPDIIIINLGTNDDSFTGDDAARKQEFEDAYLEFLKKVRLHNPDSEIFCILGIMETRLYPQVENACKRLCDAGVHAVEFECQDGLLGFSANWHPSEDTHMLAAEKLAELIRLTRKDS
jgi:lysophospholipase L1-like esterase